MIKEWIWWATVFGVLIPMFVWSWWDSLRDKREIEALEDQIECMFTREELIEQKVHSNKTHKAELDNKNQVIKDLQQYRDVYDLVLGIMSSPELSEFVEWQVKKEVGEPDMFVGTTSVDVPNRFYLDVDGVFSVINLDYHLVEGEFDSGDKHMIRGYITPVPRNIVKLWDNFVEEAGNHVK